VARVRVGSRRREGSPDGAPRRQRCLRGAITPAAILRFESGQSPLGNDYLIGRRRAALDPISPVAWCGLCDAHNGLGSDGVLLLFRARRGGFVARLSIFKPRWVKEELW